MKYKFTLSQDLTEDIEFIKYLFTSGLKYLVICIIFTTYIYTNLFASEFDTSPDYKLEQELKNNIYYINYDRKRYVEKNEYKKYSDDLSKDYELQREREEALVRR